MFFCRNISACEMTPQGCPFLPRGLKRVLSSLKFVLSGILSKQSWKTQHANAKINIDFCHKTLKNSVDKATILSWLHRKNYIKYGKLCKPAWNFASRKFHITVQFKSMWPIGSSKKPHEHLQCWPHTWPCSARVFRGKGNPVPGCTVRRGRLPGMDVIV